MNRTMGSAALALSLVICASDASACHNGVEHRVVPLTRLVARSAQALAQDRPERAVTLASRAMRRIRAQGRSRRNRLLMNRSKRVLALAAVRLDGRVDVERMAVARSLDADGRREALRWAVGILEHAFSEDGGPVATARYAEALAEFESQHRRARTLLRQLSASDVMPDAHGYRVLAELEDDEARRAAALAACRERAGDRAGRTCAPSSPGDG